MTTNGNKSLVKSSNKYYCEKCDYGTCKKFNIDVHFESTKHKNNVSTIIDNSFKEINSAKKYSCEKCKKNYNDRAGLWRHKKKCHSEESKSEYISSNTDFKMLAELFKQQMNENQEFKEIIIEQNKENQKLHQQLLEMASKMGSTTNNNTNNNQFNLQFFLNEQCKDALNIMDFVNTIKLQLSDLDMIGRLGYTEGMSKIFIRNLKELDIFKRPIHCSDLKRETLYVKDKDAWGKDTDENFKIKQAIKGIENKNIKQLPQWRAENPTAEDTDTKKHIDYQHILCESMGGSTLEDDDKKHEKIVRNIAKEVVIDKNPAK
jgi:ribosomal protein L37AE/L43A